jgi:hypothetical protein
MTVTKDGQGNVVAEKTFAYDSKGNLLVEQSLIAQGHWGTKRFTYNLNGTTATSTDETGTVTTYGYDACNGMLPTSSTAGGLAYSQTWNCDAGVMISSTDPNLETTHYVYDDPLVRLTEIDYPDGGRQSSTYNLSQASPTIDATILIDGTHSMATETTLDGLGRTTQKTTVSDPAGAVTVETGYDARGGAPHSDKSAPLDTAKHGWNNDLCL